MIKDICAFLAIALFITAFSVGAFELTERQSPQPIAAAGTR